ncbi:succinyl-diaminopimelate desuccinylase [Mumia sp. Pv 4-285]|uniref:succinyl-diaminopimelate desuccinylase n=1 Tax=Mumia qirimensis TaxID=3234852 RepID=UPI00351D39BA
MVSLDLDADVVSLTAALVDVPSESREEAVIADAVETALRAYPHLDVVRDGHTVVARTSLGRDSRVVVAGHLDTVPANDNMPSRLDGDQLWGLGSCDMKGGVAVALRAAAQVPAPVRDVTYVFYEAEEVEASANGLGRLARERPELLAGDFAILMEPSNAVIEAGCQGVLRVDVIARGERAHVARSWTGANAIHLLEPVLQRLVAAVRRTPIIDGLTYHEGLNAVAISGGVASNVVPDEARVSLSYRFAPDRTEAEALEYLEGLFSGFELVVTDSAPAAAPGLDRPAAAAFVRAMGVEVNPKFGWTDVAQFTAIGVPAVNFGPGDPLLAHKQDERVPVDQLRLTEQRLFGWLRGDQGGRDE